MTTTATETTELEEDIAIIVDMVRPFHESGEADFARELRLLAAPTLSALAEALLSNVPIIVTPQ